MAKVLKKEIIEKVEETSFSITEITVLKGKKKVIRIILDGKSIAIPVDEAVNAYFNEQFCRQNPTPLQRKKFGTIINILRAAYLKGLKDGKKKA